MAFAAAAFAGAPAVAETAADQAARIQRQQSERQRLPESPSPPSGIEPPSPTVPLARPGEACVDIARIAVTGVRLLPARSVSAAVRPFEGHCLGIRQINGVLKELTLAYVRRGYVAVRAYLPEQDLSQGTLHVSVVEGRLSGITMNGSGTAESGERQTAFPGLVGKPVNLRDVEQGLEQMSRLPGVDAKMSIEAGGKPGDSILAVKRKAPRRLFVDAGSDNLGSTATGIYENTIDVVLADPLGLNDRLSLSYSRSSADGPVDITDDRPHGDGWSAGYEVPWGYWTFGLSASSLGYRSLLAASLGPIPTSGKTDTVAAYARRVIARDRISKTTLGGSLTWTDIRSYILGSLIDVSSYRLAVLRIELAHDRRIWGGAGRIALGWSRGLDALGASDDGEEPAGSPQAQFSILDLSASFARAFALGSTSLDYEASLSAQWSDDRLYSSRQMSVGGAGSVRGVREAALFGNRAAVLRQTVSVPVAGPDDLGVCGKDISSLEAYAGFDAGHVWGQPADGIAGGTIAGATLGLRSSGGPLHLDLSYSRIVAHSSGTAVGRNGMFAASLSMSF